MKILLDNTLRYNDDGIGETYLEGPDTYDDGVTISNPDVLVLELSYRSIVVEGYRLVEEKVSPDGSREIMQEFCIAPDIAYALFKHWESLDA